MCADVLTHWPAMWTFLTVEGVEPTNNVFREPPRERYLSMLASAFAAASPISAIVDSAPSPNG